VRAPWGGATLIALLLTAPSPAAAQVAPNTATTYLHPTDVTDARALWVNPAGLANPGIASAHLDLTVGTPGSRGRLRQLTLGLNSRGLSFGYQRDIFDGLRGHTYRVGVGGGTGLLAAGAAMSLYRGGTKGTGWDLGAIYTPHPAIRLGGVIANLGQPTVRGLKQSLTFEPSATWLPTGPALALSIHGRVTTDVVRSWSFGARWNGTGRLPVHALARLDTDRALRRGAFALGLSLGGEDFVGLVAVTPGDLGGIDALSLYGVSSRELSKRRH
jgi:hypothetical protein